MADLGKTIADSIRRRIKKGPPKKNNSDMDESKMPKKTLIILALKKKLGKKE